MTFFAWALVLGSVPVAVSWRPDAAYAADRVGAVTAVNLTIVDQATNQRTAAVMSNALSGSGTYTFPSKAIKPVNAGDWRLKANVQFADNPLASREFTIKAV